MADLSLIGDARLEYIGDGSQTDFLFPFPFANAGDVQATVDGTTPAGTVTVEGAGELLRGRVLIAPAPAAGATVRLQRLHQAHVSATDAAAAVLAEKILAGENIAISRENAGGNEALRVSAVLPLDLLARLGALETGLAVNTLRDLLDDGRPTVNLVDGIADEYADLGGIDAVASGGYFHDGSTGSIGNLEPPYALAGDHVIPAGHGITFDGDDTYVVGSFAGDYFVNIWPDRSFSGSTAYRFRPQSNGDFNSLVLGLKSEDQIAASSLNSPPGGSSAFLLAVAFRLTMGSYYVNDNGVDVAGPYPASTNDLFEIRRNDAGTCELRQNGTLIYAGTAMYAGGLRPSVCIGYNSLAVTIRDWRVNDHVVEPLSPQALVLTSAAFAADSVPAEARIVLRWQAADAVLPGTDLVIEASRDGGATFSAGPVVDEGVFDATSRILSTIVALDGQPAGQAMRWRVRMPTAKHQLLHGVTMNWR